MDYYPGIDVSLEVSSVCVVDSSGKIVLITREGFWFYLRFQPSGWLGSSAISRSKS
jgi:hypothetical protein